MSMEHMYGTEEPTTGTVVIKTEEGAEVTAAYQDIKMDYKSEKEDNQEFLNSYEYCIEDHSSEPFGLFACGSCGGKFNAVCRLHTHIQSHGLGGSYHYDHRSRTAFPKYDGVCSDSQTQTPGDILKLTRKLSWKNAGTEENMLRGISKSKPNLCQNDRKREVVEIINDNESLSLAADVIQRKISSVEKVCYRSDSDTVVQKQSNPVSSAKTRSNYDGEQTNVKRQSLKRDCKNTGRQGYKMTSENKKLTFSKTNMARRGENHGKDSESIIEQPELQPLKRECNVAGQQAVKTSRIKKKMSLRPDSRSEKRGKDKVVEDSRAYTMSRLSYHGADDIQKLACFKCRLVFSSEEFLQAHMQKHQGSLICDCCNEIFQSLKELQKHVLDGEGNHLKAVDMFVCSYCGLMVTELKGLLAHLCVSAEDLALNRQKVRIYTGIVIKKKDSYEVIPLTNDATVNKSELKVQCEFCHVWLENDYFLTMHSVVHRYTYKCSKCNLHFMSDVDRDQHSVLCINPASPWICAICGKRFNSSSNLAVHTHTHKDSKDLQCEMCGKTLKTKFTLGVHIGRCPALENREKKFKCEVCDKKFFIKPTMRIHMETVHSDFRQFVCEVCAASFKSKDSLKYHLLSHKKDRPTIDCDICGAGFRDMMCFKRHKKRHTKLCTEKCTYCGKMFYERWNLKAHLRQHTGEKPYKCDTCGQGFTHNISRKTHMKKCWKAQL